MKHSMRIIENFSLSSQFPKITNKEVGIEKKLGDYYYLKKNVASIRNYHVHLNQRT